MRALLAAALLTLALFSSTDARADERLIHVDHSENITVRPLGNESAAWHAFYDHCDSTTSPARFQYVGDGVWWACGVVEGHVTLNGDGTMVRRPL